MLPATSAQAAAQENSLEAITQRLATTKADWEIDKQEPDKALDEIRTKANVNIIVEGAARKLWEGKTVSLKLKGASALSALHHILRQIDLVTAYAEEALVVTTAEDAQPDPQVTIYDIRDITEVARSTRVPAMLFGSQIDPLYYYWIRTQLGPVSGAGINRDPFWELELVDKYPPDHIGEVIAKTFQEKLGKDAKVSVSYHDGYLVVVEQPKATRVPVLPQAEKAKETPAK
jgi:hypothetical protein